MIDELQRSNFFRSLFNGFAKFWILQMASERKLCSQTLGRAGCAHTEPKLLVDHCCCSFEDSKGADDGRRHTVLGLIDLKVLKGALRLRTPVLV